MYKLWQHQVDALSIAKDRFALFFDPGCGKTLTALELVLKKCPQPTKVIVFAPLTVCGNWPREINKYFSVPYELYIVAGGTKSKKLKTIESFNKAPLTKHCFLIINHECLRSNEYLTLLARSHSNFLIIDESHAFKSPTSLQTKGLMVLEQELEPDYLLMLTGTPAPQGEIDLYTILRLLKATNDNYFAWRRKNFFDRNASWAGRYGYYPDWQLLPEAKIRIKKQLEEISITANKNLVLDLPEKLQVNLYCELSPEQQKHYHTLKEFLFAIDSDGNELNVANVISRTLRLQQVLGGHVGDIKVKDNPRLRALKDAIALTNGESFIIWTIFKDTYKDIALTLENLDLTYSYLTGEQSPLERDKNIEDFQVGNIKALIAHPRAGGVGINLTKASYSIHYLKSFNLIDDMQCEARNYRGGSEIHERITRVDIIAQHTIDEVITESLKNKKTIQEFVLGVKNI